MNEEFLEKSRKFVCVLVGLLCVIAATVAAYNKSYSEAAYFMASAGVLKALTGD